MEPANIDWKNIESIFVEDELYEHIKAPKWVDFFAPDQHIDDDDDDEAWFCKPECRHPKTAEDFLRSATKVKHLRSMSENLPLRHRNLRGGIAPSGTTNRRLNKAKTFKPPDSLQEEDQENQNPIQATPPEKRKPFERSPKLKSTLSASNLFAGRDILNQITEFCSELKKMVMKNKEGGSLKKGDNKTSDQKKKLLDENENFSVEVKEMQVVKKALPEMAKDETKLVQNSIEKKPRKLRMNEKENNPILLDMKKVITQQRLLQVRTNPPSPQCFSGYREPLRKAKQTTPIKLSKSITEEKGVLQEVGQSNRVLKEEVTPKKVGNQSISVAGKEAKSMEMFWILKPCLAK